MRRGVLRNRGLPVGAVVLAVALAIILAPGPASGGGTTGGPCAVQEGFDLWEGRWKLTLSAPGASPQVIVLEMIELGSVVTGSFATVDGTLKLTGTARQRLVEGTFAVGTAGGPFKFRMTPSFRAFSGTWFKPTTAARGTYLGGGPSRACALIGFEGDRVVAPGEAIVVSAYVQAEGPAALPPDTGLRLVIPEGLFGEVNVFDEFNSRCDFTDGATIVCYMDALGPGKRRAGVGVEILTAARHAGRAFVIVAEVLPSDRYELPKPAGQVEKRFKVRVRAN